MFKFLKEKLKSAVSKLSRTIEEEAEDIVEEAPEEPKKKKEPVKEKKEDKKKRTKEKKKEETDKKKETEEKKKEKTQKAKKPKKYRGGRKSKTPAGTPKDNVQHNFTDPESRIMKSTEGFQQCYNVQAAVDAGSQVIVAQTVTNSASDRRQLVSLVKAIKENTGRQARELSADGDYCSEANLKEVSRRHIRGYVSTGRHYQSDEKEKRAPPPTGTHARQMWQRIRQGGYRSRYRLRKQVVEPVFGQIKMARQFRQFLRRGLENVSGEWSLICTAHNLLKLAQA